MKRLTVADKFLKLKASEFLYLLSLGLYCFSFSIGNSALMQSKSFFLVQLPSFVRQIVILFLFLKIVFTVSCYTKKELYICFFLLGLSSLTYLTTGALTIVLLCLFVIGAKDCSINRCLRVIALTYSFCIIFIVFLSLCGIVANTISYGVNPFNEYLPMIRRSYGFSSVNVLGSIILSIYSIFLIIAHNKVNLFSLLFWTGISCFLFFNINAKTSALIIFFGQLLTIVFHILKSKKIILFSTLCIIFSSFAISFILPILYRNGGFFINFVNRILSNRPYFGNYFLNKYSFTFFGQKIPFTSTTEAALKGIDPLVLDNAYLHLPIQFGVLVAFIFFWFLYFMIFRCIKNVDYGLLVSLLLFIISGIFENWLFMIEFDFPLICFWSILYTKK